MTDVLDEAIGAVRFANGQTGNVHFVATIMKAVARGELIRATPEALAASPEVQALMQPDADLLLDAYRALLVLHRVLDKAGLTRGAETAENIADRIVAAHPEIPARSAIRALAPEDAIAEVARLRAELDAALSRRNESERVLVGMTLELEVFTAEVARLRDRDRVLVEAVNLAEGAFRNILELDLVPERHRQAALDLADQMKTAALAQPSTEGGE